MKTKSKARLRRDAKKAEQLFKHKCSQRIDRVGKAISLAEKATRDNVQPEISFKSDRQVPSHIINQNEINRLGWYRKTAFA